MRAGTVFLLIAALTLHGCSDSDNSSFPAGTGSADVVYKGKLDIDVSYQLYRNTLDGSNQQKLSDTMVVDGSVGTYKASPDGRNVAYIGAYQGIDYIYELYVVGVAGGMPMKVSHMPLSWDTDYAWSPDGSHLAYMIDHDLGRVFDLYTVRPDGTGNTKVNGEGGILEFEWSPTGRYLAYKADQDADGVAELYTFNTDGAENTKLNEHGDVRDFKWSPDGARLVYRADQDVDGVDELYTVYPDGTGNTKVSGILVTGGEVWRFEWSPDGTRLAYSADQDVDDVYELYTVYPDGTANTKVSGIMVTGGDAGGILWSPDGDRLAYRADQEVDGIRELFTVRPSGVDNVKVNLPLNNPIYTTKWSPDSRYIAYTTVYRDHNDYKEDNFKDIELYVANADGSATSKVGDLPPYNDYYFPYDYSSLTYSWSPDSSRMAYMSPCLYFDIECDLYTVKPDGSENIKVSSMRIWSSEFERYFSWSPDGTRLAYKARPLTGYELHTVRPDGTDNYRVTGILSASGLGCDFDWSHDSSLLVYLGEQDTEGVNELYTVSPDGTGNVKLNSTIVAGSWGLASFVILEDTNVSE
jgi:Tol biopolymer transport system component